MATQIKYLPIIRDAVKNENTLPRDLAIFKDRVALIQSERQIYGSQIRIDSIFGAYFVSPIIVPFDIHNKHKIHFNDNFNDISILFLNQVSTYSKIKM